MASFSLPKSQVMQLTKTVLLVRFRIFGRAARNSSLQKLMTGAPAGMASQIIAFMHRNTQFHHLRIKSGTVCIFPGWG